MKILAAIDLMDGLVVRGIAGRREDYAPLRSCLATSAGPLDVARGLAEELGVHDLYVADLDAIAGSEPAWSLYEEMLSVGARLWIDAGIGNVHQARQLVDFATRHNGVTGIIVGLESIGSRERLRDVLDGVGLDGVGPAQCIFSLDLKKGQPFGAIDDWFDKRPEAIVSDAVEMGVGRIIVLDLAAVGTDQGCTTLSLCSQLRKRHPEIFIATGGGIRHADDLRQLDVAGCNAALVATALHDGRLTRGELKKISAGH